MGYYAESFRLINCYVHLTRSLGRMLMTPLGGERTPIKLFFEQTPGDGLCKLCPIGNLLLCGCVRERPGSKSGLLSSRSLIFEAIFCFSCCHVQLHCFLGTP